MVFGKNLNKKFALISVFDKRKLKYLCKNLNKFNYNFLSSGSTGDKIRSLGFDCVDIAKVTKSKEMFDGRVKTFNHLIYSSLLYIRDNKDHKKQFISLKIPEIDIVVVNFYPFETYSKKNNTDKIIEMIDIGGPSLLRAASKNFQYVTPIINIKDYEKLVINLKKYDGETDILFRRRMAGKVYKEISKYDKVISNWYNGKK